MAGPAGDYHHGDMDIHEQAATFKSVMSGTKWGSLAVAVSVLLLTLWFCTDAGFFGGLIPAVIVTAIGVYALRDRPAAH
jgi:hypothetical protein